MLRNKFMSALALAATISMMSVIPAFALPKTTDANGFTWTQKANEWSVHDSSGAAVSGFISYNGNVYYLDKNGVMKTGWIKSSGSWYYMNDKGILVTDAWIDNYYVNSDGKMTKIQ